MVTGIVQEFEFGMNWGAYSRLVGNIFGAPLAMEGLAAFFLESTFLGLWLFGWDKLSRRVHVVMLAVSAWQLRRGGDRDVFTSSARLALVVLVPAILFTMLIGDELGVIEARYQPMKIAASEAQWSTWQPCSFSLLQIGGGNNDQTRPRSSAARCRSSACGASGWSGGERSPPTGGSSGWRCGDRCCRS